MMRQHKDSLKIGDTIRSISAVFLGVVVSAVFIYLIISSIKNTEVAPCNPICYPGSYDTSNPDCFCNQQHNVEGE